MATKKAARKSGKKMTKRAPAKNSKKLYACEWCKKKDARVKLVNDGKKKKIYGHQGCFTKHLKAEEKRIKEHAEEMAKVVHNTRREKIDRVRTAVTFKTFSNFLAAQDHLIFGLTRFTAEKISPTKVKVQAWEDFDSIFHENGPKRTFIISVTEQN